MEQVKTLLTGVTSVVDYQSKVYRLIYNDQKFELQFRIGDIWLMADEDSFKNSEDTIPVYHIIEMLRVISIQINKEKV